MKQIVKTPCLEWPQSETEFPELTQADYKLREQDFDKWLVSFLQFMKHSRVE